MAFLPGMVQLKDSRVTVYESNKQRTITINSPMTFRYPVDSKEYTLIMAICLSNAAIKPQEKYQRSTFSHQTVAQLLGCSNQEVKTMVAHLDKYGFGSLLEQPVEELLTYIRKVST